MENRNRDRLTEQGKTNNSVWEGPAGICRTHKEGHEENEQEPEDNKQRHEEQEQAQANRTGTKTKQE